MRDRIDTNTRDRTIVLAILLAVAFLVLGGRLFQMQVLVWEEYLAKSDANRIRPERIGALRGKILDRNGVVLADSRPAFSVSVIPYRFREDDGGYERLGELISIPAEELRERAAKGYSRPYEPRTVAHDVDIRTVSIVEEHAYELAGVLIESEPVRRYPHGALAAHLIGYLGKVSERELRPGASGAYAAGSRIGRTGVEKQYDGRLRGVDGVRYIQEDARGRPLGMIRETEPTPGEDLTLTIDAGMQALAESLLAGYEAGAVVALDPVDGAVLALASAPTFDPNLFAVSVPAEVWDSLSSDDLHPLLNRGVQTSYPPGSTFKVVTAATALTDGHVKPDTKLLPCLGSYRFGRRVFRCWEENGHGTLRLAGSLEQSCDVYYYQIGSAMNLDHFADQARAMGFGIETGIDLPTERSGLVPSTKYMNDRYGKSGWGPGFQLNHSIGQGEILSTPIQIARCYAGIGMGYLTRPFLLLESTLPDGSRVPAAEPVETALNIPERVLDPIREGLINVVQSLRGTGTAAAVPGIRIAGKTGTAENPHGVEHAWFSAYAPVENPSIAICVFLAQAGHGGAEAAPLAGALLRYHFRRAGV